MNQNSNAIVSHFPTLFAKNNEIIKNQNTQSSPNDSQINQLNDVITAVEIAEDANEVSGADQLVKQPDTPQNVLEQRSEHLTEFEKQEILNYSDIYYIGKTGQVRKPHCRADFDDQEKYYRTTRHDHLAYRYEILEQLGAGTFGSVVKAYDHKTGQHVAVKLIRSDARFARQGVQEIQLLRWLCEAASPRSNSNLTSSHIVRMLDTFEFRGHTCLTFELLGMNLFQLMQANRGHTSAHGRLFSLAIVRKIARCILSALAFLHRHHILHCDLKPENILLIENGRSAVKLVDFGTSCQVSQRIYVYVQSRYYRAPEVILRTHYQMGIDMWSLACILMELHTGAVLFEGCDEFDQLTAQMELLGMPPISLLRQSSRFSVFFHVQGHPRYCPLLDKDSITKDPLMNEETKSDLLRKAVPTVVHALNDFSSGNFEASKSVLMLTPGKNRFGRIRQPPGQRDWSNVLGVDADLLFVDFIKRCLCWQPSSRMQPGEAQKHAWMQKKLLNT